MARTKNTGAARSPAARSTARSAPGTAPAPAAGPAPASPSQAVCAALAANPGATTAAVADAAGISRVAARATLTALQSAGAVTRIKAGKPGILDTWTLTAGQQPAGNPGAGHQDEHAAQPGDSPAASNPDDPGLAQAADARDAGAATPAGPGQHDEAGPDGAPDPEAGQSAEPGDGQEGEDQHRPGEDDEPAPGPDQDGTPASGEGGTQDAGAGSSDSTAAGNSQDGGPGPGAAVVAEITGRIEQIQATASASVTVLTGGENPRAVLAGLDEIYEQAAQARRTLKAALGGKKAPAIRAGGLREKILAHLHAHPGQDFTPHEIHKVLGHSSGAIANALDTLVKHGQAELGSEKPRKFHLAPNMPSAAGSSSGDGTELAGAA